MSDPPDLKRIFTIDIAEHAAGYYGVITSVAEEKALIIKAPTIRLMLAEISKQVKRRRVHLRRFPAPEKKRIITLDETTWLKRVVTPNGN